MYAERTTLGISNNNPGNIRWSPNNNWKGQIGLNRGFCVFSKLEYGLRALMLLLRNYINRGVNTPRLIVSTYAPSSENNTEAYIDYVCRALNCTPNDKVAVNSDRFCHLVSAICYYESRLGVSAYEIRNAYNHYFNAGKPTAGSKLNPYLPEHPFSDPLQVGREIEIG